MCTSPIRIKNHSRTFVRGVDRDYLLVPCGKCADCRKRKSNDLYVRSFFEFEHTKLCNGFAQLITLTYNDSCLPRSTSYRIPCFSRTDITNFLKRLRQYLLRHYNVEAGSLRYTMCCEYGGERQRPHYHFVFFVNSFVSSLNFVHAIRECWKFGFVATTNDNNGVINSSNGLKYVAKYVSKDVITSAFFEQQVEFLRNLGNSSEVEELKKHMPFNRRSIGFGDFGLSDKCKYHITLDNLRKRNVTIVDSNGVCTFALPLHYVRRALYDKFVDKEFDYKDNKYKYRTTYFLNELGKSILSDTTYVLIENSRKTFSNALSNINSSCARYVSRMSKIEFTSDELKRYLGDITDGVSSSFVEFALFYSGYSSLSCINSSVSSSCLGEDMQDYITAYDLKSKLYFRQYDFEFDCLYDVEERLTEHLAGLINSFTSKKYMDALFIFDFIFKFLRSHVETQSIQFEKSYMFRKYVANV